MGKFNFLVFLGFSFLVVNSAFANSCSNFKALAKAKNQTQEAFTAACVAHGLAHDLNACANKISPESASGSFYECPKSCKEIGIRKCGTPEKFEDAKERADKAANGRDIRRDIEDAEEKVSSAKAAKSAASGDAIQGLVDAAKERSEAKVENSRDLSDKIEEATEAKNEANAQSAREAFIAEQGQVQLDTETETGLIEKNKEERKIAQDLRKLQNSIDTTIAEKRMDCLREARNKSEEVVKEMIADNSMIERCNFVDSNGKVQTLSGQGGSQLYNGGSAWIRTCGQGLIDMHIRICEKDLQETLIKQANQTLANEEKAANENLTSINEERGVLNRRHERLSDITRRQEERRPIDLQNQIAAQDQKVENARFQRQLADEQADQAFTFAAVGAAAGAGSDLLKGVTGGGGGSGGSGGSPGADLEKAENKLEGLKSDQEFAEQCTQDLENMDKPVGSENDATLARKWRQLTDAVRTSSCDTHGSGSTYRTPANQRTGGNNAL